MSNCDCSDNRLDNCPDDCPDDCLDNRLDNCPDKDAFFSFLHKEFRAQFDSDTEYLAFLSRFASDLFFDKLYYVGAIAEITEQGIQFINKAGRIVFIHYSDGNAGGRIYRIQY